MANISEILHNSKLNKDSKTIKHVNQNFLKLIQFKIIDKINDSKFDEVLSDLYKSDELKKLLLSTTLYSKPTVKISEYDNLAQFCSFKLGQDILNKISILKNINTYGKNEDAVIDYMIKIGIDMDFINKNIIKCIISDTKLSSFDKLQSSNTNKSMSDIYELIDCNRFEEQIDNWLSLHTSTWDIGRGEMVVDLNL